jgi:hypothetical protein
MRVYEVVDLATSDAPPLRTDAEAIVAAGRRRRRNRRLSMGAAAVAVLAVTAIAVPFGLSRLPAPRLAGPAVPAASKAVPVPQTFPVPSGPFTFTIKPYDAGAYHVATLTAVSAAYQRGPVYKGSDQSVAELTVYRAGAFAPDRLASRQKVTVAGHQGWTSTSSIGNEVLAWEYTTGAWATLESSGVPREDQVAIAAGLVPGPQVPARLPFTVGRVPAGYVPIEATDASYPGPQLGDTPAITHYGGMLFNNPAPPATGLTEPWNYGIGRTGGFYIAIVPNSEANYQLRPGQPVPSSPSCASEALCHWWSRDGKTQIELVGDGKIPDSQLIQILRTVQLADLAHPDTWPLATDVVR